MDIRFFDNGNSFELRIFDFIPQDFLTQTYEYYSVGGGAEPNNKYPLKGKHTLVYKFIKK